MAKIETEQESTNTEPGAVCVVCGHGLDSHDTIAHRFCTATAAGGFRRGCVCVSPSPTTGEPVTRSSTVD
ncbi:RGCVC family protein [Amycolatopsis minnesotensis]|uniref:Uncharacterized protein n=1 Tax=Amycolatopsis minnesotensis TaxID=337894 RepID=A0ABP5CLD8_9PSEU